MEAEYWGQLRQLADEPETDDEEIDEDEVEEEEEDDDEPEEEDALQLLLAKCYDFMQKGGVAILLLLVIAGVSRADSLTETQVAQQLQSGAVIPLASGVDDILANNLLAAQLANISYTANEPTSLQLSIDAVLKAIGIYVWPGGPTQITDAQNEPIVFVQSEMAIDTGAGVSLSPTSIDFGSVPVSTPEPSSALLLLLPLCGLVFLTRSASERDVEKAIEALEIDDEDEKQKIRNYYRRDRAQNRAANIALIKALGRLFLRTLLVLGKVTIVLLLMYLVMVGMLSL